MKLWSSILLMLLITSSCQDVVDVALPPEETKLIFEAVLRYNEEQPREDRIQVSTTGSFFETIQPAILEEIQIQNETQGGVGFYAPDSEIPGDYIPGADGVPFDDIRYVGGPGEPEDRIVLSFFYEDELYLAVANYVSAPKIDNVQQGSDVLFNEEDTEIIVTFTDVPEEDNFYIIGYGQGEYVALSDTFFDGQEYSFSYFSSQELNEGAIMEITLWGVDEALYNYYLQLIEQSEQGENSLFQTPVATVRGNILKVEDIDNITIFDNVGRPQEFVLGYFAYIQEHSQMLTIE